MQPDSVRSAVRAVKQEPAGEGYLARARPGDPFGRPVVKLTPSPGEICRGRGRGKKPAALLHRALGQFAF